MIKFILSAAGEKPEMHFLTVQLPSVLPGYTLQQKKNRGEKQRQNLISIYPQAINKSLPW